MSSDNGTIFQATAAAEPPGALRIKPSRNKPDASSEWKCLQCNKNFSRKSALKVHNRKSCRKVQNSSGSVNPRSKPNIFNSLSSNGANRLTRLVKPSSTSGDMSSVNSTVLPITVEESPCSLRVKQSRNKPDGSSGLKCLQCRKYFSNKYVLEKHNIKSCRKVENSAVNNNLGNTPNIRSSLYSNSLNSINPTPTAENARRPRKPRHPCTVCEKSFANKLDLVYHIRSYHPSVDVETVCPIKSTKHKNFLVCPVCPGKIKSMIDLSDHIRDNHALDQTPGFIFLHTVAEFLAWKDVEESRTVSRFVKERSEDNKNIQHYYCRRSGSYKSRGTKKRHMKIQGTCKVGSKCPASITAVFTPRGVMVIYASTHNGHSIDIKHVGLSHDERMYIGGMISKGIPFDDILDSVRNSLSSSTEMSRLHLLVRKDLQNIARDIRSMKVRHMKDAETVRTWVEMCRQEKSDLVRFIKYHGEEAVDALDSVRIALDEFMIVLMNDVQVYMLQQYGHHRVNCMDSIHGANLYDFHLTTLTIVDDYGEVFPVAFCISSQVDTPAMEVFLENVRTAIGGSVPGVLLMTDDNPEYVNAWTRVMGPPDQHVLCTWHVNENWRKNLAKVKHSTEAKTRVHKMLRALLEIDNKEKFHCLLDTSLHDMEADEGLTEFLSYFQHAYVSRPEMWAYSYWLGLPCHHNVQLDVFHQTLTQGIMQGTTLVRLNRMLDALLRLLRFKSFERILKQDGCDVNQSITDILERHTLSGSLQREQIDDIEDGHWLVHDEQGDFIVSRSSRDEILSISRLHASSTLCPLACDICNVCVHSFTCTCMDYQLQNTVCIHIHAVVQLCGIELVRSDNETQTQEAYVVNLTGSQSVVDFKIERADSPLEIQPDDVSSNATEMDISLDAEESESMKDREGHLKEIDELMNTIRGSLVASLDHNLFDTVKERYKTFASQIHVAITNGSSEALTNL